MTTQAAPSLRLDHASLEVPRFREAVAELAGRFGLTTTVSAADPDRHGRVHLDRTYLEVASPEVATHEAASHEVTSHEAASHAPGDDWALPLFFFRFDDPVALRHHLDRSGLPCVFDEYEGVDGRWDDVSLDGGPVPLPILVRRTHPVSIARDWPPPLRTAHPCGATILDAVHVTVPELPAAIDTYRRLVGPRLVDGNTAVGPGPAGAEIVLERGRVVLAEGAESGVVGIVLGVGSLEETGRVVGPLTGTPVGWIDPTETHGVKIGFRQI